MATFNVQIEKLNANNYSNWAADIKYLLLDKDCWSIVTGTEEIPVLDPDKGITHRDLKEYRLRASTAISTIYLNISPEFRKIIEGTEDARVAWDSLKKFFEPDNRSRHMQLFSEFLACKILPGENISLFAAKLLRLQEKLKGINHPIDEDYMCFQLLRYLPSRYDSIVQSILRWSDDKFKFNEIQLELVAEESRLQVRASDNNDEHIEAHSISSYRKSCRKSLVCFHCNRSGHFRNKCPELQKKVPSVSSGFDGIPSTSQDCGRSLPDTSPNPSSNNQRRRRRTKIQNTNPSFHGNMSYLIQACTSEVSKASDTWVFDTAASHHFCKDKSIFNEYVPISDEKMTVAVEGVTIPIEGKAFLRDGLYEVNPNILNRKRVGFSANSVQKLDARLWHSRLAHIGSHTIQNTVKNKGVRGLKGYVESNLNCEVCKLYKHRRTSFKATNFVRSKAPNDLIFMDTWGPIKVTGRNGARYYLSIIDDFSKKTSVYPLREKSEVFRVFKNHVSRAERFIGRKVKCIRTDNGSEFTNDNFKTFCADNGIKHEFTNIYTPEQNGVAERYNQTALDCSRCMLADSGLDNKFWPDAILCFTYVWNRICHKNQVKTPFELFGGYKPSVRHLKAFGATAYVGLPRQLRSSKLGPKAKKGILIGYAFRTKGYRIWFPDTDKVIETINVTFCEEDRGVKSRSGAVMGTNNVDESEDYNMVTIRSSSPSGYNLDSDSDSDCIKTSKTLTPEREGESPKVKCVEWIRKAVPRKDGSRTDIYYYEKGCNTRIRSVDTKKYCEDRNIEYIPSVFDFRASNTYEGIVPNRPNPYPLPNSSLCSS
ncbi:Retrovirus-related Pol polyprotein from transposon TNT 1-94 [Araneus ventricosus]|uniref:Retrovirus-related Pol polyprotein from transposon TNT 1-94 n=1 Tax=Araneus ventricosus TaxID=182803 RepID=A0A4Y2IME9_ARAVE|nr:Retrovirus-related Pol polyprotein from transposon TNT 1-94 [Araneus ventricosus]GBM78887.1 Retrovirus-related Pol polyprotein from transposon TNT 1-94 [Araneus ventricosus]